jgi:hypothetical protein
MMKCPDDVAKLRSVCFEELPSRRNIIKQISDSYRRTVIGGCWFKLLLFAAPDFKKCPGIIANSLSLQFNLRNRRD